MQHDDKAFERKTQIAKREDGSVSFSMGALRQQIKTALAQTTDRELRGGLGHALKAIERHEQGKTGS